MRARLLVFPVNGRNWCFSKCVDRTVSGPESTLSNPPLKELWKKIDFSGKSMSQNAETIIDFGVNKMNRAWVNLEKAPSGSIKNKIHGFGTRLLSRVNPAENFVKSISKGITKVEISYPPSLNPRLVRRRLRHIAYRGSIIHKRYFYGSLALVPFASALSVLPLPNIAFFWIIFRAYSHWQALKGSERLLLLVSDCAKSWSLLIADGEGKVSADDNSTDKPKLLPSPWVLQPSKELEELLRYGGSADEVNESVLDEICNTFSLEKQEVLKFKDST